MSYKTKKYFSFINKCWLFTIFKQYKTNLLDKGILNYSEINFEEILAFIMNTSINIEQFYQLFKNINAMEKEKVTSLLQNIEILYVYISKVEYIKKEEMNKAKRNFENRIVSKDTFENILVTILSKGVNLSINEINKYETHKENLLLYNVYNKVSSSCANRSVELSSNSIFQKITKRKTSYDNSFITLTLFKEKLSQYIRKENQFLLLFSEFFFDFANTSFCFYLKDIKYLLFTNTSFENKLLMLLSEFHKNKNVYIIKYLYLKVKYILYLYTKCKYLIKEFKCSFFYYIESILTLLRIFVNKVMVFNTHIFNIYSTSMKIGTSIIQKLFSLLRY